MRSVAGMPEKQNPRIFSAEMKARIVPTTKAKIIYDLHRTMYVCLYHLLGIRYETDHC